ncbi:MAG: TetR/AcrR family transcriptional regulator [Leptospirales bacterium]|nr:TetR/AcrR family transcriptional regulator [Leptospirales bacterium]
MIIDHATKENILKTARTEFSLHGFSGARLAVIAENAGINKALIHYYFKSKDLLYENVWESFFMLDDNLENIPIYFDNISFTTPEKLYLYIYITVNLNTKFIDMEIVHIFLWELAEGGKFLEKFRDKYFSSGNKFFNIILEIGEKEGIFDLKYKDMVLLGMSSINFVYKIEQSGNGPEQSPLKTSYKDTDEKLLDFMINYVFKMLSPPNKPIPIPKIKPEILEYIDKLLHLDSNKISIPVSRRILEFLCNDLV